MTLFINYLVKLFDVSQAQDDPSTEYRPTLLKALEAGFWGIIVRVGFGRVVDRAFRWFWTLAKGIFPRKPYWYGDYYSHRGTTETDEQWGEEQADVCWNELKGDPGEMPLAWDAEYSKYGGALTATIKSSYNRILRGFKNRWKLHSGKDIEIYCSPSLLWLFEDDMKDLDLYLAWWNNSVTQQMIDDLLASHGWRGKVKILQVTNSGDIDNDGLPEGIELGFESSGLDLDVFPEGEAAYKQYTGGFVPNPAPVIIPEPEPLPIPEPEPTPEPTPVPGQTFADVPPTHWAFPFIEQLYKDGVVSGSVVNGQLLFSPNANVTRAQLAVMLVNMKRLTALDRAHLDILFAEWQKNHPTTVTPA